MVRITSDDPRVTGLLGEVAALLAAEGAVFHPAVELVCTGGSLSMRSGLPADSRELLVQVPAACVPSVRDFRFRITGDELTCTPEAGATPLQVRLMEHLVALYNATGKLREHAATSPWFAFAGQPALLARLAAARSDETRIAPLLRAGRRDEALVTSFFDSRCLHAWNGREDLVMPVVDLANHHGRAPGLWFGSAAPGGPDAVGITNWQSAPGGEVCYAYSPLDALDLFTRCGFADATASFVQSVPHSLPMPGGGALLVRAWPASVNRAPADRVPPGALDLTAYLPRMTVRENRGLGLAFLLIPPPGADDALRRVLAYAIGAYCTQYRVGGDLQQLVAGAEEQVIAANLAYLAGLRRELAASGSHGPAATALDQLITHQAGLLEAYRERAASLGWDCLRRR